MGSVQGKSNSRRREVAALLAATRAVLEIRAFADAASAVLGACKTILGAEAGLVAVCAAGGEDIEVALLDPGSLELDTTAGLPASLRRLGARACKGRTVFANHLAGRPAKGSPPGGRSVPENALLAPVLIAGDVAGLLGLLNKPGGFSAADSRLAEVFAEMTAVAMLRSRTIRGFEKNRTALEGKVRDAASQLLQAEGKFRTLVENLPDVVARFDPALRHLYVSSAVHSMTGVPSSRCVGKTNRELGMPSELVELWDAALRRVFATGRPEKLELAVPLPTGTRHFDCRILPEHDAGGAVLSVLSVARDVTDHRLADVENAVLFEQMQDSTVRMQSLSRRLVEAQENERRHIARELHDEAGQALASLRFGLRLLEREIDQGGNVTGRVAELMRQTDAVLDGLHRLAADLRPASLDHLGLEAALRQYARSAASTFGLAVHFKARGFTGERLPTVVETALYRVVQEAMTNVVRHARATRVDVLVEHRGDRVLVMVEDDGVGFEPDRAQRGDHLGLLGLRERAEGLGGTLTIESTPGAGATVVVEVASADPHPDR